MSIITLVLPKSLRDGGGGAIWVIEYLLNSHEPTGKHWSAQKVANTFTPRPETKNTVLDWLVESGIQRSRLSLSTGKRPGGQFIYPHKLTGLRTQLGPI